jgi:hypothetical protein
MAEQESPTSDPPQANARPRHEAWGVFVGQKLIHPLCHPQNESLTNEFDIGDPETREKSEFPIRNGRTSRRIFDLATFLSGMTTVWPHVTNVLGKINDS